jgi:hypothetical protein
MTTALEMVSGQRRAPAAFYPGKDPVPIVQEAGWAPGPVWTSAENLAPPPTGIRSPDRLVAIPTELLVQYTRIGNFNLYNRCGIYVGCFPLRLTAC